ncbi:uncharacterized protein LOC131876371 [Cryptomeria japonica]|uniref:uncharacterized protein LOC131876371 n=1 Tax=Cryptomeria japonica TaxID=3369 RepID=UPI0027DAAAA8|nr:uncharacterized protein LOC131876371 [Cryptomeria japonica]XP_059077553.1 uncharacterized protein LOC131876371 [Cryptomeria japonica]
MADFKEVVEKVLLPLQLILGLFLIMKTTPLWAVIHCTIAYLLNCFHIPCTDYKRLQKFEGRVFKKVISHATIAGDVSKVEKQRDANKSNNAGEIIVKSENGASVSVDYLGQSFVLQRIEGGKIELERKDGEKILKKDGEKIPTKDGRVYYITDKMWETVQYIAEVGKEIVFVKNYKEIWEEVVTGDIMEFEEVLDSVILDNRSVIRLDHDYFLPVNLMLIEFKLTVTLNFVALFLRTQKHIHWFIPALMTFTAAVMGFGTTLRLSIDDYIATILCRALQWVCDLLPLIMRRRVYYWGSWVQHFRPSNDLQSKIVRGDISVLIAGGAKFDSKSKIQPINFPECSADEICSGGGPALFRCSDSNSDSISDSVYIEWIFVKTQKCLLKAGRVASNKSLKPVDTSIVCGDGDSKTNVVIQFFTSGRADDSHTVSVDNDSSNAKESLMADDSHTASVDIDCCEAKESLMADDSHTASVDIDYCKTNRSSMADDSQTASVDIDCCKEKESLMADDIHTASVDIYCSKEEAMKLFIFAAYMAKLKSGSLKSYDRNSKTVNVRRFIESINAYVRSGYPPLHTLELKGVVVRPKMPKFRLF